MNQSLRQIALEALRLRRWALAVLADAPHDEISAHWRCTGSSSPAGWELFLRAERVAYPLRGRLSAKGLLGTVPEGPREVLSARALEEMQRLLSARAQLRSIGRWAAERSVPVVVLKGGVAAPDDRWMVDLSDVDVLVASEHAEALTGWLDRSGYSSKETGPGHHRPARLARQMVAVEVHLGIPEVAWDESWLPRAAPLEGGSTLRRLAPAGHLLHVLVHATIQHNERRGRLRDLLLIRHAVSLCSPSDLAEAERRIEEHPGAEPLRAVYRMARAIGSGGTPVDLFLPLATGRYLAHAGAPGTHSPGLFAYPLMRAYCTLLEGKEERRRYWRSQSDRAGAVPGLRWLEGHLPALARGTYNWVRKPVLVAAMLRAWPAAGRARALAREFESTVG